MSKPKITAADILKLLEQKHADDVFVAECKNGPSKKTTHLRLDAWVLRRSWAKPCVLGYEIKVSRSDFLGDNKWHGYLPLCNEFYFVAPSGVIKPGELPEEAGLLLVTSTATRLWTKKKAPHRNIDIDANIFRYVLISRAVIASDPVYADGQSGAEYWRRWLAQSQENREIGWRVSRALSERYQREVTQVREHQRKLEKKLSRLEGVERLLRRLKISVGWRPEFAVEQQYRRLMEHIPGDVEQKLQEAQQAIAGILEAVEKAKENR